MRVVYTPNDSTLVAGLVIGMVYFYFKWRHQDATISTWNKFHINHLMPWNQSRIGHGILSLKNSITKHQTIRMLALLYEANDCCHAVQGRVLNAFSLCKIQPLHQSLCKHLYYFLSSSACISHSSSRGSVFAWMEHYENTDNFHPLKAAAHRKKKIHAQFKA